MWARFSAPFQTGSEANPTSYSMGIARAERDGTRAETGLRLSPKRTSPFKSVGTSVQSTAGSRGVRISLSNAGYIMFGRWRESTGYPLHSPVSPSLPLQCVTVCNQVPNELYTRLIYYTMDAEELLLVYAMARGKGKVKQSRYRLGVTQRFPGSCFPDFMTTAQSGDKVCHPYAPAAFTPQEIHLILISVRGCDYVTEKFQ